MRRDLSPDLERYLAGAFDRPHIFTAVADLAGDLADGASVLDAGAGEAPFRELFAVCRYVTSDWAESVHPGASSSDVIAPLDDLPLPSASFDAVLCTQVLEHVPDPFAALAELRRVLRPGGSLLVTVPFVGELHEEPYDFFRYTPHGLRSMLDAAGFESVRVGQLGGAFTVAAHLVRNWSALTGGGTPARRALGALAWRVGPPLARLDRLDRRAVLTLGYAARGVAAAR